MVLNAKMLTNRRPGFTLIELLIVLTIIGILAAVAVPKFVHVRERAHFKAMMSDLRNLQAQQESYYSNPTSNFSYAANASSLTNFVQSPGVTISISQAGVSGFAATAAHAALQSTEVCAVFVGTVTTVPAPATTPGVVTCTGEM
jgi:prepilin-type N-terminal cleavage/methylation domain-containing protein